MNLSLWIARRYIFARRTLQFISVITVLSLTGIAVGVAAIICVSSIFNGFRELYQSTMIAFDPHARVVADSGAYIQHGEDLCTKLRALPHVRSASAVTSGRAVITTANKFQIVELRAVQMPEYSGVSGVQGSVVVGQFLSAQNSGMPQIVIGAELAMNSGLEIDDTLSLLSPRFIESALQSLIAPQGIRCVVRGIFYTNSKEYNSGFAYCGLATGRELFDVSDQQFSSVDIRLDDPQSVEDRRSAISAILPPQTHLETWYDLHRELYGVMQFERFASFIILSIIVLVSVFNIFAMLTMTIVKKRTDIGLLQALGADVKTIQRIFLAEGLIIGFIGTLVGLVLGLGLCYLQITFEIFRFDPQSFIVSAIPVRIAWTDVVAICILTIGFSFIATIYPAKRAARTVISRALRTE